MSSSLTFWLQFLLEQRCTISYRSNDRSGFEKRYIHGALDDMLSVKAPDCFSNPGVAVIPLRWRHNGCDSVSNHQPGECLLRRLIRRTSKKTSKLRVTGLCAGNSPETGEFPAQMASNAENVSIWWRHHADNKMTDEAHKKDISESVQLKSPGPRLNIKTVLSTYGDFHAKDKTAVRTSYL